MKALACTALAFALMASLPATAHDIAWQAGAARTKSFGHCAKGACQRRAAFETATVPHRHVDRHNCVGQGAGGYRLGQRFDCRSR